MKSFAFALLAAATLCLAQPVHAANEDEVSNQIETVLGDAEGFNAALGDISQAILDHDADTLATLTEFPLGNRGEDVEDTDGLKERWDDLFTPKVVKAIENLDYGSLIVNSEGVGIGDGDLWINHFCVDDACSKSYWALARINN